MARNTNSPSKPVAVGAGLLAAFLMSAASAVAQPEGAAPEGKAAKVAVCHFSGNGRAQRIEISENALPAHLEHGDVPAPASVRTGADCLVPQPPPGLVSGSARTDSEGAISFVIPETNIIARLSVRDAEKGHPLPGMEVAYAAQGEDFLAVVAQEGLDRYLPALVGVSLLAARPGSALTLPIPIRLQPLPPGLPLPPSLQSALTGAIRSLLAQPGIRSRIPPGPPAPCPCGALDVQPPAIPAGSVAFTPGDTQPLKVECGQKNVSVTAPAVPDLLTLLVSGYGRHVTWYTSQDPSVASVDFATGLVSAVAPGRTTVGVSTLIGRLSETGGLTWCSAVGGATVTVTNPVGACCGGSGGCSLTSATTCSPPLSYQGDGTTCDPGDTCGACCDAAGGCADTLASRCSGTFHGSGSGCLSNPCTPPPQVFRLTSSRSLGGSGITVPVTGSTIKILISVPGNLRSGSGTTGDCGLGDRRVSVRVCPPNAGCTGFDITAGQGQGLNICHELEEVLGPYEIINPRREGTGLSFTAITVNTAVAEIEIR